MASKINTRFYLLNLESAPSLEGFVAMPDHNIAIRKIRALENEQKRKKSCLPAATGKTHGRQEYLAPIALSGFLWQVWSLAKNSDWQSVSQPHPSPPSLIHQHSTPTLGRPKPPPSLNQISNILNLPASEMACGKKTTIYSKIFLPKNATCSTPNQWRF